VSKQEEQFIERVEKIAGAVREAMRDDKNVTWQDLMRAVFGFAVDCAMTGHISKSDYMKDAEIAYDWFILGKQ
jgi:hypothetical protein